MIRLVRAELLKLRTTHTWWIFGLMAVVFTVMAILANIVEANVLLRPADGGPVDAGPVPDDGAASPGTEAPPPPPSESPEFRAMASVAAQAAGIYTSGQFIGLLLVMILGALLVTNEFHHQTATVTFLTTPKRTLVVLGKLITATLLGVVFWLVSTVLSVVSGAIALGNLGYGPQLGESSVVRAVALNLLGYIVWTILGVGLGVLIRNQIASVLVAVVTYFIGIVAETIVVFLSAALDQDWLADAVVLLPSTASQLMTSAVSLPDQPPQWVGAAVLVGYGVVAGVIGTLITRTRDIS